MGEDVKCKLLCQTDKISTEDAKFINERISENYAINWVIDGLPAAHEVTDVTDETDGDQTTQKKYYRIGFPLGFNKENPDLNNHYRIIIKYHETPNGKFRVVGVVVAPYSKDYQLSDKEKDTPICDPERGSFQLKEDGTSRVLYTYSVIWEVSFIKIIIIIKGKKEIKKKRKNKIKKEYPFPSNIYNSYFFFLMIFLLLFIYLF